MSAGERTVGLALPLAVRELACTDHRGMGYVIDANGLELAYGDMALSMEKNRAIAKTIVQCVNAYDSLLSEREALLSLAHKFARECSECNGTGKSMEFVETLGADGEADAERVQLDCYSCRDIRAVICGDPEHPMASQADAQIAALTAEREALRAALRDARATLVIAYDAKHAAVTRIDAALTQPVKP